MKKTRGNAATRRVGKTPARRVSVSSSRVITLLTDFGIKDYFVGAVKGVILGLNPEARVVDLTHEIPEHDIEAAALTILAVASSFPAGTIHLAVVDPGVGSSRKPLMIQSNDQFFVGPDNGLFSYVMKDDAVVYEVDWPCGLAACIVIVAHEVIAIAASMTRGIRRYLICCSFQRVTDAFATVEVLGEPTSCETDAITQLNSEQ